MPERSEELRQKLRSLPESPGCYLMKSGIQSGGKILYVGKAVNLKNRVRSYFQASRGHTPKVMAMIDKIEDFDIMLCDTNLEALILECNLIKRHMPYYNILLKDDKAYPYLRIDLREDYPRLELARRMKDDGARYFGPYIGATSVREVIEVVRKVFPLRTCTKAINPGGRPLRPCLHHQIGQCLAPCAGNVTREAYHAELRQVIDFLSGRYQNVADALRGRMLEAAAELRYEQAATLRQQIQDVEMLMEKQKAVSTAGGDQDILALAQDGLDAMVQILFVRGGRMVGGEHFALERAGDADIAEVMQSFLLQFYEDAGQIPAEILTEALPEDAETVELLLREVRGAKVALRQPQRGQKHELIALAKKNAEDALQKRNARLQSQRARTVDACAALGEAIGLPAPPRRIEGYDISNTQGTLSVGAMVVCVDGVASKKDYRHFRIKTVQGPNDFASMHEVITRRFEHAKREREERAAKGLPLQGGSFTDLPDLVLIDGGPQQLAFALRAMRASGFDIPMFGLAEKLEEIYLPGAAEPLLLDRHSPALHLIQRVRDEAHRFGVARHRGLRGKSATQSQLEEIPGVGPARRRALLKHFKNIEAIRRATPEQLCEAPGITKPAAQAVYLHFLALK
ncbi:MAG: excinuclease ABC subunit UvrC [Clostridia bacterium]|nr:excinuclease ABC subunit UvrC [Clostridia bacterium]